MGARLCFSFRMEFCRNAKRLRDNDPLECLTLGNSAGFAAHPECFPYSGDVLISPDLVP